MSILTDQAPAGGGQPPAGSGAGGDPGNQADWRSALPEDLRGEKVFESIKGKDWSEAGPLLAKGYVNAQRMVGAEKLVVPGEQATPDKYTYKLPEGVKPEHLNKPVIDNWLKELHEAGVPAKQADRILTRYLAEEHKLTTERKTAQEAQVKQWELSLKEEYGAKYDERLNYAKWALKSFGDKDGNLVKFLDQTNLGSHPAIVKFFADVGAKLADHKAVGGDGGPRFSSEPRDAAEAQAALTAFNRDPEKQKALFDKNHPQHDDVVRQREGLFKAAFPKDSDK